VSRLLATFTLSLLAAQPPSDQLPILSTHTELVVLPVTVTDRSGAFVDGLHKSDFVILDEGRPQQVQFFSHQDVPVTVGLVVDNSTSMQPKWHEVVQAIEVFARSSNPLDELFPVLFNEHVSMALPAGVAFTQSGVQLRVALTQRPPIGKTALYDAVMTALDHLRQGSRSKRALVLISDGGDNASRATLPQVLEAAHRSDAIIFAIGVFDDSDQDRKPGVLKALARATGGDVFLTDDPRAIVRACERIARDLRSGYLLGYVPSETPHNGRFRTVRVEVTNPAYRHSKVRTRAGYYASEDRAR
jgi:Ca-activated chloride channel family protein